MTKPDTKIEEKWNDKFHPKDMNDRAYMDMVRHTRPKEYEEMILSFVKALLASQQDSFRRKVEKKVRKIHNKFLRHGNPWQFMDDVLELLK